MGVLLNSSGSASCRGYEATHLVARISGCLGVATNPRLTSVITIELIHKIDSVRLISIIRD